MEQKTQQNLHLITHTLFEKLETLQADTPAKWGVMNAQETIEHLEGFFNASNGTKQYEIVTDADKLPLYIQFLWSDKEFRENTKAPESIIGETPFPLRYTSLEEAIMHLKNSVTAFVSYFENASAQKTIHPVFGALNFSEWLQLHAKHVRHHLRQFGLWE